VNGFRLIAATDFSFLRSYRLWQFKTAGVVFGSPSL